MTTSWRSVSPPNEPRPTGLPPAIDLLASELALVPDVRRGAGHHPLGDLEEHHRLGLVHLE